MDRYSALGIKLTPAQFRMLQRIPDEGLPQIALRQGRSYSIALQIRTLRILIQWGLVDETQSDSGDVRFELTDAGRRLARSD
jgi:DNA-binding MarR family transcriptional regulator